MSMMFVLGTLCLLSVLAVPGHSLTCIECMSTNSTSCTGDAVTCPNGYICATSYTESTIGGMNSTRYVRSCAPQILCNKSGTITTLSGATKMSTNCCLLDNCTAPVLAVPSVSSQPNGVTCPSCQSSSSGWCYDKQTVECSGEESVCAHLSINLGGNSSSIRGCARESSCGSQSYTVNGTAVSYQFTCYCGGNASNTYCPEMNATCPNGTICTTVYASTKMGDASLERRTSTCLPIYQCGIAGSATFLKGTMRLVTLCSTNDCKLPEAQFSERSPSLNGVMCRNCMAADTDCYTADRLQCTGNEQWCFFQTSDLTEETSAKTAIRGCSSQNICDIGTRSYNALGIQNKVKYVCSGGSKCFLASFPIFFVLCTLILKY